jgi:hypothetical protein
VRGLVAALLAVLGLAMLALALVVWDLMLSRAFYQGGFTESLFFFIVLVSGGFMLLVAAVLAWRSRPRR